MGSIPLTHVLQIGVLLVFSIGCEKQKSMQTSNRQPVKIIRQEPEILPSFQTINEISLFELNKPESNSAGGFYFQFFDSKPTNSLIIFGYNDKNDATGIRVNNILYKLNQISINKKIQHLPGNRIREHTKEIWSCRDLVATINYRSNGGGENHAEYIGTITIEFNNRIAKFKIKGGCGC